MSTGLNQRRENEREANDVGRLRVPVVYTAIKNDGEDELSRPLDSLWWSGIAAGLAIFLSVVGMGTLYRYLGGTGPAGQAITYLGYTIGFVVVIMGRLQLFTENTITAVVPLLAHWKKRTLYAMLRLWAVVFVANMVGVFIAAFVTVSTDIFPDDTAKGMIEVSRHYIHRDAWAFFLQGIPAGFLVAAIVWMMPSAKDGNEFWVIILLTYLIAAGGFTHVIAGSGEVFIMLLLGEMSLFDAVFVSILPTLAGNVIGGTALFTVLAHGQVHKEI
jgi:Formate/nitrite family of transporters